MFKKHTITIISILLMLSFSFTAFAASFPDVTSDYSWAQEAISEMSDAGIISGYPDGTFKPASGITKIQAMLLISRILGYNESVYSPFMQDITENAELSSLNLTYENEVAFLVYKGVFTSDEIANEASSLNEPLLRYEAAEYLTRAMGKYSQVKENYSSDTGYSDQSGIPASYRPFVTYVKDASLMLGTDDTSFSPERQVTRAQMAVLLMRVITNLSLTTLEADILSYSSSEHTLKVSVASAEGSYDTSEAYFYINGETADPASFKEGETVILVFADGVLSRIEKIIEKNYTDESTVEASTVNAKVDQIKLGENYISVTDSADNQSKRFYFADDCKAVVDGATRTLSAIRAKDHVLLSLNVYDEVISVTILDMESEFTGGTIESISTKDGLFITVRDTSGRLTVYTTTDNVAVARNSELSSMNEVLVGDTIIKCTLQYNKISALQVKSIVKKTEGSVTEIVISSDSSIVIDDTRYAISDDIAITVDGEASDIYGLRIGMRAEVTLDSNTITKITVTSVADAGQFTGRITIVNKTYNFVNIVLADGSEKQIFIRTNTNIQDDATGRSSTFSSLSEGDNLLVIGKLVNGAFYATTVILLAD